MHLTRDDGIVKAVLDANVLFPFTLRDTLLRAAAAGFFQLYWSEQILEETTRNLVRTGTMTAEQAARLRLAMENAFPESRVTRHEALIGKMPNDRKDRHVAAAAIEAGAQLIVTSNLRDFTPLPTGLSALSPDDFLCRLLSQSPAAVVQLVRDQAAALRKPQRSFAEVTAGLAKTVPRFAAGLLGLAENAPLKLEEP